MAKANISVVIEKLPKYLFNRLNPMRDASMIFKIYGKGITLMSDILSGKLSLKILTSIFFSSNVPSII